jgi:hypothetical protein
LIEEEPLFNTRTGKEDMRQTRPFLRAVSKLAELAVFAELAELVKKQEINPIALEAES